MITDSQNILMEHIENSWINEPTKKASLEKFAYIRHRFVMPDFFDSDEAIDRYYENVGTLSRIKIFLSCNTFSKFSRSSAIKIEQNARICYTLLLFNLLYEFLQKKHFLKNCNVNFRWMSARTISTLS